MPIPQRALAGRSRLYSLDAREFVFRIYPREGNGTAAGNPRLDCLRLAEDPDYQRTDEAARQSLAARPQAK